MSPIPDEVIEQVRDAADLVGLIGAHVELKRTGTDYRGPCPFHGGTHRNFAVIPKKGMYYCFVCHAGGDVFTFFMKKLGMDYPTAVREVARRVGITIPERSNAAAGPDPREPLFGAGDDGLRRLLRAEWLKGRNVARMKPKKLQKERDKVEQREQIGLRPRPAPEIALAELAADRDQRQEYEADRRQGDAEGGAA